MPRVKRKTQFQESNVEILGGNPLIKNILFMYSIPPIEYQILLITPSGIAQRRPNR
jgi:hypothetical protein